jgi:hypothetical protein
MYQVKSGSETLMWKDVKEIDNVLFLGSYNFLGMIKDCHERSQFESSDPVHKSNSKPPKEQCRYANT